MPRGRKPPRRPLGRPPATASAETRARILAAARTCFARSGYAKTTNNDIAAEADLTSGAIYHYFESKPALFAAVVAESSGAIMDEFEVVAETERTFADRMRAIIDLAAKLHAEDPSLAAFSATYLIELQRHPELVEVVDLEGIARGQRLFLRIAQDAVDAGELDPDVGVQAVADMITAFTLGFSYFGSMSPTDVHVAALGAAARLFDDTLFSGPRRRRRRRA